MPANDNLKGSTTMTQNPYQGPPPGYPPVGYPQQPLPQGPPPGQWPGQGQQPAGYPPYPQPQAAPQGPPPGPPPGAPGDDPFGNPDAPRGGGGDGPGMHQLGGRLLLVRPYSFDPNAAPHPSSTQGPGPLVRADLIVCDGEPIPGSVNGDTEQFTPFASGPKVAPFFVAGMYIRGAVLPGQLESFVGGRGQVLGRLVKGTAGKSGKPPWILQDPTEQDKVIGRQIHAQWDQIKAAGQPPRPDQFGAPGGGYPAAAPAQPQYQQQAPAYPAQPAYGTPPPAPQGPPPGYGQAPPQWPPAPGVPQGVPEPGAPAGYGGPPPAGYDPQTGQPYPPVQGPPQGWPQQPPY